MTAPAASAPPRRRPLGVTIAGYLGVIEGFLTIAIGIFVLIDNDDAALQEKSELTSSELIANGIIAILIGLIIIGLALALFQGSEVVRFLYGVFALFHLGYSVYALIALHGEQRLIAAFSSAISVFILWALFVDKEAQEYFGSRY
jgi:hypothetical protein